MNRREFTVKICQLIMEMAKEGKQPIIDWAMRSKEAQFALYRIGRTLRNAQECDGRDEEYNARHGIWDVTGGVVTYKDGYRERSNHQSGKAMDIYLVRGDGENVQVLYEWPPEETERWHKRWEEMGGRPVLRDSSGQVFDAPHFEG